MTRTVILLAIAFLTSSCTINQSVTPSGISDNQLICIIEDPEVREGFLDELTAILNEKKIAYEVVNKQKALDCEWTMTYLGRWSWDMALYMSYAEIKVFRNGIKNGEAIYDASRGAFNLGKFIDAETKIRELVEELIK